MPLRRAAWFVLVLLSVSVTAARTLVAQPRRITPTALAAAVDSVVARAVADGLAPALGVAITLDGRTILAKAYGFADTDKRQRADDRTLWYLASTSKSFTGFGVSLLEQQGVLSFATPITALLPRARWHASVPADSLTLAHFLSHTHRVSDNAVTMSAAFTGEVPESQWPALLRVAERSSSSDLVYSNIGYNVAAMVIDARRPEGWKAFLQKAVYEPAGMRETYTRVTGIDTRRIAVPHRTNRDGTFGTTPFFKTDATMNAAGGHLSTLHDLARWTIVQMDSGVIDGRRVFPAAAVEGSHRLIARQTRDAAKRFAFFERDGWGAGWDIGSYEGERMVSRFGSYDATRSHLSFLPGRRIGAVVMSSGGTSALTDIIAALAYDLEADRPDALMRAAQRMQEIRERQAASVRSAVATDSVRAARQAQPLDRPLQDFAGSYTDPSYGTIVFTVHGRELSYRWGALYGPVEIFDAGKQQMRLEIAGSGTVVTFSFEGAGPAATAALQGVTLRRASASLPGR